MESEVSALGPIAQVLKYPIPFYSGCLILLLLVAVVWWWLPTRQARLSARKALRTDLSLFFTGTVVALGVVGAIIQFQANVERDQRQERLALSSENAKRFDNAINQLRKNSDLARLGAIYMLAELSKQDGFYWPSIAQLVAYLRHVAPQSGSGESEARKGDRSEIQNSLYILSERDKGHWQYRLNEPFPLDLASLSLKDLRFSGLKLWGSNFRRSDLSGSILSGAKLEGSDFYCANFEKVNFMRGYLHDDSGVTEIGPKLSYANFRNARLDGVNFKKGADSSVEVDEACFEGATIDDADISGFDFTKAKGLTKRQIESSRGKPKAPTDFKEEACTPYVKC